MITVKKNLLPSKYHIETTITTINNANKLITSGIVYSERLIYS